MVPLKCFGTIRIFERPRCLGDGGTGREEAEGVEAELDEEEDGWLAVAVSMGGSRAWDSPEVVRTQEGTFVNLPFM